MCSILKTSLKCQEFILWRSSFNPQVSIKSLLGAEQNIFIFIVNIRSDFIFVRGSLEIKWWQWLLDISSFGRALRHRGRPGCEKRVQEFTGSQKLKEKKEQRIIQILKMQRCRSRTEREELHRAVEMWQKWTCFQLLLMD